MSFASPVKRPHLLRRQQEGGRVKTVFRAKSFCTSVIFLCSSTNSCRKSLIFRQAEAFNHLSNLTLTAQQQELSCGLQFLFVDLYKKFPKDLQKFFFCVVEKLSNSSHFFQVHKVFVCWKKQQRNFLVSTLNHARSEQMRSCFPNCRAWHPALAFFFQCSSQFF